MPLVSESAQSVAITAPGPVNQGHTLVAPKRHVANYFDLAEREQRAPSARSLLPEFGSDPVAAVRAGLPYAALARLQSQLDVSDARLASILGVSPRTLRRRREAGTLPPDESDRLVCLAKVVARARRTLDDAAAAREWFCTPHSLLGGETPLDRMDTVTGMDAVQTMLDHIEHGMPV